jgi:tetratricopeptide (TPR) repeat protein
MIKMQFYIQFRGQLRRTRPELIASLENTVAASASAASGAVEQGRKALCASFNEGRIGFWLDLVIFLEKALKALNESGRELYGYAIVLGWDISDGLVQKLCRSWTEDSNFTGIWCSDEIRKALEFYIAFENHVNYEEDGTSDEFWEIREFLSIEEKKKKNQQLKIIKQILTKEKDKNTLLLGLKLTSIKEGIYCYCAGILGDIPPLVIRFSAIGLMCFVDAFSPRIRSFIAETGELGELDAIHSMLFGERLRKEWSFSMMEMGRHFISSLILAYVAATETKKTSGVLILEDLSGSGRAASVFLEVYSSLDGCPRILAADSSTVGTLINWDRIFPRVMGLRPELFTPLEKAKFPMDLLELSCNISLLRRYFPSYLLPQLFEEEGLNREVYFRALKVFSAHGVSAFEDPWSGFFDFACQAQMIPVERMEVILSTVRSRILSWVLQGKLHPCFNLLVILSELGGKSEDALVLKSIRTDVHNGACSGIEEALKDGSFDSLAGTGSAGIFVYFYKTLKALVWGGSEEIRRVFQEPLPSMTQEDGKPCFEGCQAHVQTNLAAFYLADSKIDPAAEAVRVALLLNRGLGKDEAPAYRLFSLVNFARQRISDALEYINFALEQAERNEQTGELFLSCYYASSINLIYGNLSKAERLAKKAEETAAGFEQAKWKKRAKFLRGRVCFETGKYKDALDIFKSLLPAETGSEMENTVRAWIYRTRNFLNRFSTQEEIAQLAGPDAAIFEIEAAYFAADYKRVAVLAAELLAPSGEDTSERDFVFTEQPDWRSGFSQSEYIFRLGKAPGMRLAWAYHAMAQCAMDPSQELKTEILGGMQRTIREELLPDTDPYDAICFHAWYCMLRDSRDPNEKRGAVDISTVVSMACKRLQRRAERIDDLETKQAFLNLPRWNNALFIAARELKLI